MSWSVVPPISTSTKFNWYVRATPRFVFKHRLGFWHQVMEQTHACRNAAAYHLRHSGKYTRSFSSQGSRRWLVVGGWEGLLRGGLGLRRCYG